MAVTSSLAAQDRRSIHECGSASQRGSRSPRRQAARPPKVAAPGLGATPQPVKQKGGKTMKTFGLLPGYARKCRKARNAREISWEDASSDEDGGWPCTEDRRTSQAAVGVDGVASRSPSWVHSLGAVCALSGVDRRQRAYEIMHGAQGRSRRTSVAVWPPTMPPLRPDAARVVCWHPTCGPPVPLPGRPSQSR